MKNVFETLNIRGFSVEIFADDCATENPLEWSDTVLVTAHRRSDFGGIRLPFDACSIEDAFDEHLADNGLERRDVIWEPVYLYDHSGYALSTSPFGDRWDSGRLGFIYVSRAAIRQEFRAKRISAKLEERIVTRLEAELDLVENWLNGEIYRYHIPDLDQGCGGFFGCNHERSGLVTSATEVIDDEMKRRRTRRFNKLKQLVRNRVPLNRRADILPAMV